MGVSSIKSVALLGAVVVASFAGVVQAVTVNPPITWCTPTTISGESDILTTGTLVAAFDTGAAGVPGATVNGVNFQPFAVVNDRLNGTTTVGNYSMHFDFRSAFNFAMGSASGPFSGLSAEYRTLLQSAAYDSAPEAITLTIIGLTPGQAYNLEVWANYSNAPGIAPTTVTSTNITALDPNVGNISGGVGQYVIGNFTANGGGSEVITLSSAGGMPIINAFQLRTAVAVPEPASLALLVAGGALTLRRRGRR